MRKHVFWLTSIIASSILMGCAGANIKTNKSASYSGTLAQVLFAMPSSKELGEDFIDEFKTQLTKEFAKRGVTLHLALLPDALALDNGEPIDVQAQKVGATSIMTMLPRGGRIYDGRIARAYYDIALREVNAKSLFWRGEADLSMGTPLLLQSDSKKITAFVAEIIKALTTDGLLSSAI